MSYEIKGCAINVEMISNSNKILNHIKLLLQAHNQIDIPSNLLPPQRKIYILEDKDDRFEIQYQEYILNCNSTDEVLGIVIDLLYNKLPTENMFYLHGGAVSKNNICIALLAPSNMGKTTMVMDLLERGYGYYSDDIVPIIKEDMRIYSFPKPLFLRPNSPYSGISCCKIKNGTYERVAYTPLKIEYQPCSLSYIFILNRDGQFEKMPAICELSGVEKIKSVLYNVYAISNTEDAIIYVMRLLRHTKVCRLDYYSSNEAINCLEAYVQYGR